MPNKIDLDVTDALLDAYEVNLMIYEPHQDADWVQHFSTHPGWELVSQDQDMVLFCVVNFVFPDEQ
jgi:hypothetical protein